MTIVLGATKSRTFHDGKFVVSILGYKWHEDADVTWEVALTTISNANRVTPRPVKLYTNDEEEARRVFHNDALLLMMHHSNKGREK